MLTAIVVGLGGVVATTAATARFLAFWLLGAGCNLGVGVNQAGYALSDERPIFRLIFAVPGAVAVFVRFRPPNAP